MRKISSMLLGCTLLLGAGCAAGGGSGGNAAPGAKERLVSTRITNATWDHILEGQAAVTDVKQKCKEGNLNMYVSTTAICPAQKPAGAKDVSRQQKFTLAAGEHLCAAVGNGEGPCTLTYQVGAPATAAAAPASAPTAAPAAH